MYNRHQWWDPDKILRINAEDIYRDTRTLQNIPSHLVEAARWGKGSLFEDVLTLRSVLEGADGPTGVELDELKASVGYRLRGIIIEKIVQPHIVKSLEEEGWEVQLNRQFSFNINHHIEPRELDVFGYRRDSQSSTGYRSWVETEDARAQIPEDSRIPEGRFTQIACCEIKTSIKPSSYVMRGKGQYPKLHLVEETKALGRRKGCEAPPEVRLYMTQLPYSPENQNPILDAIQHARRVNGIKLGVHKVEIALEDGKDIMKTGTDDWVQYVQTGKLPYLPKLHVPAIPEYVKADIKAR